MAVVQLQRHHTNKALTTPTWFLVNVTPPPAPREGGRKAAPAAYSPLLLSPAVWQQDEKKRNTDDAEPADGRGLPASPRISCMGQVKGRRKRSTGCSSARGPPPLPPKGSRYSGTGGTVANLVLGLFGMRRRNARTTSRACAKVRDVPRACGTAFASAPGSTRGGVRRGGARRGVAAVAAVGVFDPPLPVAMRRPGTDGNAPSLWERRRGGRALEGLQLMT